MSGTTIELPYAPFEKQNIFHASTADIILYGGAAGGGKSRALREDFFLRCLIYPGYSAAIFRRQYPELQDTHIQKSLEEFPPELGIYNKQHRTWSFKNGSRLTFNHAKLETDVHKYNSVEWDALGIDEAGHFTEYQIKYLLSRNRSAKRGVRPIARLTANPGGPGHAYLRKIFIAGGCPCKRHQTGRRANEIWTDEFEDEETGLKVRKTYQFIPAFLWDNPALLENDPDYIANLNLLPEHLREALKNGCWEVFAGQAFPEWAPERGGKPYHVIPQRELIEVRRYRAIDWGYSRPFWCGWFAVDEQGREYLYREVMKAGLMDHEQAELVMQLTPENEQIEYTVADPSIFFEGRGKNLWGITIAQAYSKMGLHCLPGDNSRIMGKQMFHRLLSEAGDGLPRFQVMDNCRHFIECVPNLLIDSNNMEDVAEGGDDHPYDGTRYFFLSPAGRYQPPKPEMPEQCIAAMIARDRARKKRKRQRGSGYVRKWG